MRKWSVLLGVALFFPATAFGYTVTYSSSTEPASTSTPQMTCAPNSTLQGAMCYCNAGYKVSGTSCVKDEAMPPGTYEIYPDVRVEVGFNTDLSCAQMGLVAAIDVDMCKRYQATPDDQKDAWKTIPRPSTVTTVITNPWAPPGQQILGGATTTQALAPIIPPAPPPPPPAPIPPPAPPPEEAAPSAEDALAAQALAEAEAKAVADAAKIKPEEPATTTAAAPDDGALAQVAGAAAPMDSLNIPTTTAESVDMSKVLAGLTLIPAAAPQPAPEQTVDEPAEKPSLFARIVGFFAWLF